MSLTLLCVSHFISLVFLFGGLVHLVTTSPFSISFIYLPHFILLHCGGEKAASKGLSISLHKAEGEFNILNNQFERNASSFQYSLFHSRGFVGGFMGSCARRMNIVLKPQPTPCACNHTQKHTDSHIHQAHTHAF